MIYLGFFNDLLLHVCPFTPNINEQICKLNLRNDKCRLSSFKRRKRGIYVKLTIWSIVGIILLQKGVISLCEKTKARNDTVAVQEKATRWNEEESNGNRSQVVKFQIGTPRKNNNVDKSDSVTSNEQWPRKLYISHRTGNAGRDIFKAISTNDDKQTTTIRRDDHDARDVRSIQTPTIYTSKKDENTIITLTSNENHYDKQNSMIENSTSSVSFEFKTSGSVNIVTLDERNFFKHGNDDTSHDKGAEKSKSGTKSRLSPVNRIGAAIALIMLAIGVAMLLLGPLIVIVRAFSNRRRTREMLKARCYNDQPPTYEEATLMDQAPRYSTLQLDTILDSSLSL
ncbi:PREDICTED: uncharacterized protein LOC108577958 isoform X2 [Habropoda laboriosa]|uniref:uncharacterized protein LOC108577958 isoform X2 n=1 Tax=Habropoda laboriosa TaxID=597456 RepID=UPI00083CAC02|nr:PREDICTED: uncharacterized protein LOC108577958 isoform X2 [Habropoda laboriosa]